ncbi:MAG: hypothetical protein ABWZ78_06870, partial [Burkholderiaceae bacterium]
MDFAPILRRAADGLIGRWPARPRPGPEWGDFPERGPRDRRSGRLLWRQRLRRGRLTPEALGRLAAARIFAIERDPTPFDVRVARCRDDAAERPWQMDECLATAALAANRALGLRPHLQQLTAAAAMLDDRIVELPAGEGHQLSVALAAAVRALAGVPVHVVLRTDSLALDALARHQALFELLGLSAAAVTTALAPPERAIRHRSDLIFSCPPALMESHGAAGGVPLTGLCSAFLLDADRLLIDGAHFDGTPLDQPHVHGIGSGGIRSGGIRSGGIRSGGIRFNGSLPDGSVPDGVGPDGSSTDRARSGDGGDGRPGPASRPTLRQFFQRYWRLGGICATARESAAELASVYGLRVVVVPSIYPAFARDLGWRIAADAVTQRRWLLERVIALREARRAVIVLASDRAETRVLAQLLIAAGIEPVRCDVPAGFAALDRAAAAGKARAVSLHCALDQMPVAVIPEPLARAAGGLALIATAIGPSRRHDRHYAARIGHQGQPGTMAAVV